MYAAVFAVRKGLVSYQRISQGKDFLKKVLTFPDIRAIITPTYLISGIKRGEIMLTTHYNSRFRC